MTTGTIAERVGETTADHRYALKLVALFSFGWLVLTSDVMILNPLIPLIRQDFQLSGTQVGLLTTAFYLPYLLMQVPAGLLSDRLGPKRVLVVMTLVGAFALGGIGLLAFSLATLAVFGAVHRAGSGVYYSTAFGITVNSVPRAIRGVSSAALSGGMALGTGVGLAIAVPLAYFGGGWRFPFVVMAAATVFLAFLFLGIVRSGQRIGAGRASGIGNALRDSRLWLLFGVGACTNLGFGAVTTWGPSFLSAERGLTLALAGLYTALISFVGFPAGFVMGRLSDRIGRRPLTAGLFASAGLCVAALAAFPQPLLMLAAIAGYGLTGKWASDGVLAAWVGDRVTTRYPAAAASVFGVNNACRMVGAMLSPLAAGALLDLTGSLEPGLYAGAASLGLGAILALLARDPGATGNDLARESSK